MHKDVHITKKSKIVLQWIQTLSSYQETLVWAEAHAAKGNPQPAFQCANCDS